MVYIQPKFCVLFTKHVRHVKIA